ncbi:protein bicaudal C homolog 1-like [Oscarella lobularis]|uniref:protein bicaudal C homolog 1-like n=1 Tax=Oscarella lobularis TaxID=121494 RepID=UPI0033133E7E
MATAQSTETGPIVDVDAPPESSSPRRDEGADSLDPDAVEERMRVDRRKLEQMLQTSDGSDAETADAFFERVMRSTGAIVNWPSKLKIGAKSKKDPHIRITGKVDEVARAKEMVMAVLDVKSSRVTLKMDVSHLDHSHVIGKGGSNIKKVMEDTQCHIHFPDSNRSKQFDKSNQVSIAGQPSGVEAARRRIRELVPLTLTFELPLTAPCLPDVNDPLIQRIADHYQVAISFKSRPRAYVYVAVVRGCVSNTAAVKEATVSLIEHLTGQIAASVPITIQMDIAPQHHLFMIGRNGSNIKHIMSRTGANIQFPNPEGPHQAKSSVFITGSIDSVCLAREQLTGCLPLVLMFDLKDESSALMNDAIGLSHVMETLDVFISIKPRPKQQSKSVIVKTVERNHHNMYYARVHLLDRDPSSRAADSLGLQPPPPPAYAGDFSTHQRGILNHLEQGMLDLSISTGSSVSSAWSLSSSVETPTSSFSGMHQLRMQNRSYAKPYESPSASASLPQSHGLLDDGNVLPVSITLAEDTELTDSGLGQEQMSKSPSPRTSPGRSSIHSPSPLRDDGLDIIGIRSSDSFTDVMMAQSKLSPDGSRCSSALGDVSKSPSRSSSERLSPGRQPVGMVPRSLMMSPSPTKDYGVSEKEKCMTIGRCGSILPEAEWTDRDFDYERKRRMASEAMKKPVMSQQVRTPTNTWSGLYFSKSMPEAAIREKLRRQARVKASYMATQYEGQEWDINNDYPTREGPHENPTKSGSRRNLTREFDVGPLGAASYTELQSYPRKERRYNDLGEFLTYCGLSKYVPLFEDQEVDLGTFLTLGEHDLKELGVTTFGARKKMLLAIADFQGRPLTAAESSPSGLAVGGPTSTKRSSYDRAVGAHRDIMSLSGRW